MKIMKHFVKTLLVFSITPPLVGPSVAARQKKKAIPAEPRVESQIKKPAERPNTDDALASDKQQLAINKQNSISSLISLAHELKSEADKPEATKLQAQIADVLWQFDETMARSIFRQAFDDLQSSINDGDKINISPSEKITLARRQASALKDILRLLGNHDRKTADEWLNQSKEGRDVAPQAAQKISAERIELLALIAVDLAETSPKQALQVGLNSLSGERVPEAFGRLLFTLDRKDKSLSNALYRGAVANLQRNGYSYDHALNALANYVFDAQGRVFPGPSAVNALPFINYLLDATKAHAAMWRERQLDAGQNLRDLYAAFFTYMTARGLQLIGNNAPDKLPLAQELLNELAVGMSQQTINDVATMTALQQDEGAIEGALKSDPETQLRLAEKENNSASRDNLYRSVAIHKIAKGDPESAIDVAAKINNSDLRARTEDDIRLLMAATKLRAKSYDEAQAFALQFNDPILQVKFLIQLADGAWTDTKDRERATDLLTEGYKIAIKSENTPDKVENLLTVAEKFIKVDRTRAFEVLTTALTVINQIPSDPPQTSLPSVHSQKKGIYLGVAVGGKELSTNRRATVESMDFGQAGTFAKTDYILTSSLAQRIDNKLLKTRFLIAAAKGVISLDQQKMRL